MDHAALHSFIPVYLEAGLTRFGRKFNVLQNKLLTRTADNGRVRGIKMNPGSQREDSHGDVSTIFCLHSTEPSVVPSVHAFLFPLILLSHLDSATGVIALPSPSDLSHPD